MVKAFPHHELSRKAAFMVLYGYKDLQEWASLEDTARHYLKHRILMKKKAFRREVFAMLIRAAYQPLWNEAKRHLAKQGEIPRLLVRRLLRYEREFGVEGSWLSKGFPASARASYALAIAGRCLTRNKRMFGAIDARKRLIRLYPSFPKRANVMRELGVHYRQIAYYKLAADWFERYLRETLGAKGSYEQQAAQARKWSKTKRKRWEMALFQAATLRKGLGNWRRAVALWKSLLILFPKHKTASNIRIEVARIYERARQYSSAILAYQKAIQEDRSDGLKAFFKKLARRKPKPLAMIGMTSFAGLPFRNGKPVFRGPKPGLLRHVGRLTKAATVHGARELFLLSRLAHCYGKRKQKDDLQRVHMQMNALGFQMVLQQHAAMKRGSVSRGLFARARFALVEQTRALYHSLAFTGSTSRNRVVLRTLMKEGKRLHQQYAEVVGLGIAQWALASVFRQGQLLQAFAEKLSRSPVPAGYRGRLARRYRELLRMRMVRMEDRALAMYEQVLRLSARFGVYNRWVRACEQARNALTGKRNKVNPFTIFQRRKSSFWLVETPFVTKLFSTRPVPRTKPTVRR
jgi:tetratricopeptide (TPR) repeat protein